MKMDNKIHHHSNWMQQRTLIIVIFLLIYVAICQKKGFCVVGETGEMELSWKFPYVLPLYCANLSISVFILGNFLVPHPRTVPTYLSTFLFGEMCLTLSQNSTRYELKISRSDSAARHLFSVCLLNCQCNSESFCGRKGARYWIHRFQSPNLTLPH